MYGDIGNELMNDGDEGGEEGYDTWQHQVGLVSLRMIVLTSSIIMALDPPAPSPFSATKVIKVLQHRETPTASNVDYNGEPTFSLIFIVDRPNRKVR